MNTSILHPPSSITKAMLFAAGLGTRLKPFTDHHPKALAMVNGKPLLERNIEYLKEFGVNEFVINVHHFADQIKDFLVSKNNFGVEIHISDESDEVLETGGGLVKAKNLLGNEPFLVMNVDILTDLNIEEMIQFHLRNKPLVTMAVSDRNSSRKLLFEKDLELKGWRNLNSGESIIVSDNPLRELAFSGIHIIDPKLFKQMPESGKFSIMTTYMELMKEEKILGFDHSGGILIDVGRPESVLEAERIFV
ncbi:nucleotidyltransferase family protein [Moheibacter lacus]|uniref:Nucleotidyltransferase family protein n=1 Tax=Moheibacter lacus TaxID=2745851 RepID=A0A838ZR33_9FLAO|nr:nucleotidyltransferase family protein [Moheibacter lacus]MBA5628513.1 nucleotidyltransferase family protein [Moheibacter lacus]